MIKAIATIVTMVVVLIILGFGGWYLWTRISANHTLVKAQTQAGVATVGEHQAQAQAAAQRIIIAGDARQHLDIQVHQDNAHAIAQAPGADTPINPALIAAADRGLCRYASQSADPGCAGLRQPDPAVLPSADRVGGSSVTQ